MHLEIEMRFSSQILEFLGRFGVFSISPIAISCNLQIRMVINSEIFALDGTIFFDFVDNTFVVALNPFT